MGVLQLVYLHISILSPVFINILWVFYGGVSSVLARKENTEDQLETVYCPSTFPVPVSNLSSTEILKSC